MSQILKLENRIPIFCILLQQWLYSLQNLCASWFLTHKNWKSTLNFVFTNRCVFETCLPVTQIVALILTHFVVPHSLYSLSQSSIVNMSIIEFDFISVYEQYATCKILKSVQKCWSSWRVLANEWFKIKNLNPYFHRKFLLAPIRFIAPIQPSTQPQKRGSSIEWKF